MQTHQIHIPGILIALDLKSIKMENLELFIANQNVIQTTKVCSLPFLRLTWKGSWKITRKNGNPVLVLDFPDKGTSCPSAFEIAKLPKLAVPEVKAFKQLPAPQVRESTDFMYKCGVPLEQQLAGKDCCSEIVDGITSPRNLFSHLFRSCRRSLGIRKLPHVRFVRPPTVFTLTNLSGAEVKEAISHRVSRMCMVC